VRKINRRAPRAIVHSLSTLFRFTLFGLSFRMALAMRNLLLDCARRKQIPRSARNDKT